MCDNLLVLEIGRGERLRRCISVYKTRRSGHDESVHPMTITEAGVRVE
jgi:KaiC/GvpD/RAD55 family RecA-like ATPase